MLGRRETHAGEGLGQRLVSLSRQRRRRDDWIGVPWMNACHVWDQKRVALSEGKERG